MPISSFELVKRYQNIPLITKTLTDNEANEVQPTSATEILNFIIAECTDVAKRLPLTYVKGFKRRRKRTCYESSSLGFEGSCHVVCSKSVIQSE